MPNSKRTWRASPILGLCLFLLANITLSLAASEPSCETEAQCKLVIAKAQRDLNAVERDQFKFDNFAAGVRKNLEQAHNAAQARVETAKKAAFAHAHVDPASSDIDEDTLEFKAKPAKK